MKFKFFGKKKKEKEPDIMSIPTEEKKKKIIKSSKAPIDENMAYGIGYGEAYVNRVFQLTGLTTSEMWECYRGNEWVRACVDKIIKEVVKYKLIVKAKETEKEVSPETQGHIDEVRELLKNPNIKSESFDSIRRKYLKDILIYDAGGLEIVYTNSGREKLENDLTSLRNKLIEMTIKKKVFSSTKDKFKLNIIERQEKEIEKEILLKKKELNVLKQKIKNEGNKPIELYDVAGVNIKLNVDKFGNFKEGKPAYYLLDSTNKVVASFSPTELIYFMSNPTAGSVYGLSPIETIYNTVQADNQAAILNRRRLDSDGMISGVLSFPGMSSNKLRRNKMFWKQQARKKGARLVLTSAKDVKFIRVSETHEEMQFMEYQKWSLVKIMAVYGMQPIVLGVITENTGKLNSEQQRKQFKADAVIPLLNLEAHHLTDVLVNQGFGYDDIEIDYVEPEQELTRKENAEIAQIAGKLGVITINEAREMMGLDRLEEGGENLVFVASLRELRDEINKSERKDQLEKIKERITSIIEESEPKEEKSIEEEE